LAETYTAEQLVRQPSLFEVKIAIGRLKIYIFLKIYA